MKQIKSEIEYIIVGDVSSGVWGSYSFFDIIVNAISRDVYSKVWRETEGLLDVIYHRSINRAVLLCQRDLI